MSTLAIFIVGLFVTGITLTAVVLVGLSEAADPAHSRTVDLLPVERSLVGHLREDLPETSGKPE
jgi:hypothetical protein